MNKYRAKEAYLCDEVATGYDCKRFASPMGRFVDWREKTIVQTLLDVLPVNSGRTLDLPCGTGRISRLLRENGHNVVAADISPSMIRVARHESGTHANLEFALCDAEELPFGDAAFDCVISLRFMGHLPPQVRQKVIREMSRVTRNWLILFFYDPGSVKEMLRRAKKRRGAQDHAWYTVAPGDLERELRSIGLRVRMVKPVLWRIGETYGVLATKICSDEPRHAG